MRTPLFVLLLAGCATPAPTAPKAAVAMLQADRQFDLDTAERGVDGWVSWFASNGSMMHGDAPQILGHDAIRAAMAPALETSTLRWQPDRAEELVPGALGVTTGTYVSRTVDDEGVEQTSTGRYISVWKMIDGNWMVIFDTGVPDP